MFLLSHQEFLLYLLCGSLILSPDSSRAYAQCLGHFFLSTFTPLESSCSFIAFCIKDLQIYVSNLDLPPEFQACFNRFFLLAIFSSMSNWHLEMSGFDLSSKLASPEVFLIVVNGNSIFRIVHIKSHTIILDSLFLLLLYILSHLSYLLPLP